MEYVIASSVGTDNICLADGTRMDGLPGGAGIYALAGIRLWTPHVAVAGGVSREYVERHGGWYRENGLSMEGLVVRSSVDAVSCVDYRQEDDRTDQPDMGLWEFRKLDPDLEEVGRLCGDDTKGIYFFKHLDREFLSGMAQIRERYGCRTLWEISEDAAIPEHLEEIEYYLEKTDLFSINRYEASVLYGTHDMEEICRRMEGYRCAVFFRQGSRGAYMIANKMTVFCPSVADLQVVDPTGGGNSSSAAVLYAWSQGLSPAWCGAMGAASASVILEQFGPPRRFEPEAAQRARRRWEGLTAGYTAQDTSSEAGGDVILEGNEGVI